MDNKFFVVKLRSNDTDGHERNYSILAVGEDKREAVRNALTSDCLDASGATLCSTKVVEHDGREVMMEDCIEVCEPTFRFLSTFI